MIGPPVAPRDLQDVRAVRFLGGDRALVPFARVTGTSGDFEFRDDTLGVLELQSGRLDMPFDAPDAALDALDLAEGRVLGHYLNRVVIWNPGSAWTGAERGTTGRIDPECEIEGVFEDAALSRRAVARS